MKSESGNETFWKDLHILDTLRGGGIFFVLKIVGSLGAYFFAWYISKHYGAEGNGVFAFVLTSSVLLAAFFNLGLNTYVVKLIPAFQANEKTLEIRSFYHQALMTIMAVTILGCGLLILLSRVVPEGRASSDLFLIGITTIPVSIMLFLSHVYKAQQRILGFSLLQNNVIQVMALLILLIPVWTRISVVEPIWAFIIAGAALCLIGWVLNPSERSINATLSSIGFRSHLGESLPMLAGGMAFIILSLTDRLMLRFFDTTAQLGIYDVVLRLSNLTLLGLLSINAVAEPKFSQIFARNDLDGLRRFAVRMTWIGIAISIPVIGLLGLFPHIWLGLFGSGDEFLSGETSLYILLVAQAVNAGCGAVLVMLNMTGHQRSVQTILVTCASLNIGLNFLLIPSLSIEGAAWATAISTLVWNVWGLWVIRKKLGFWLMVMR